MKSSGGKIPKWYIVIVVFIIFIIFLLVIPESWLKKSDNTKGASITPTPTITDISDSEGVSNLDELNKQIEKDNKDSDTSDSEYSSEITPIVSESSVIVTEADSSKFIDAYPEYKSILKEISKSNFESYFTEYTNVSSISEENLYKGYVTPDTDRDFSTSLFGYLDEIDKDSSSRDIYAVRSITLAQVLNKNTLVFVYNVDESSDNNILVVKYKDTSDINLSLGEETAVLILDVNFNKVEIGGKTVLFGVH